MSKKNGAARAAHADAEPGRVDVPGRFSVYTDSTLGIEIRSFAHALNISAREFFEEAARRYIADLKRQGVKPFLKVQRLKAGRPLRVKR